LPDEQFPALYGLLFDKTQDFEVLDEIFSDALNRPEEIKVPLMKIHNLRASIPPMHHAIISTSYAVPVSAFKRA